MPVDDELTTSRSSGGARLPLEGWHVPFWMHCGPKLAEVGGAGGEGPLTREPFPLTAARVRLVSIDSHVGCSVAYYVSTGVHRRGHGAQVRAAAGDDCSNCSDDTDHSKADPSHESALTGATHMSNRAVGTTTHRCIARSCWGFRSNTRSCIRFPGESLRRTRTGRWEAVKCDTAGYRRPECTPDPRRKSRVDSGKPRSSSSASCRTRRPVRSVARYPPPRHRWAPCRWAPAQSCRTPSPGAEGGREDDWLRPSVPWLELPSLAVGAAQKVAASSCCPRFLWQTMLRQTERVKRPAGAESRNHTCQTSRDVESTPSLRTS